MQLVIDTTTSKSVIALDVDGQVIERKFEPKSTQRVIFQELSNLLDPDTLAGLSAITIGIGPGSFTGVKIGVIAAKTLAWSRDIPIVGVCSLDAVAAGIPVDPDKTLIVAVPSTRGEAYIRQYRVENENWRAVGDIIDVKLDESELLTVIPDEKLIVSGESAEIFRDALGDSRDIEIADPNLVTPTASGLFKLGNERHDIDDVDDPLTLLPLYVRASQPERLEKEASS